MSASGFPRPLPSVEGDAAPYWRALREERIELPQCDPCGRFVFPPRPFCPRCHGAALSWKEMTGRGRVYTFSIVHRATHPWFLDKTPYVYAIVELDEGVRFPTTIVGCAPGEVCVGQVVEPVFERVDDEATLLFFRPTGS